jgi:DNA-binding LacI/PurR family transcriptional regulator
MADVAKRAGVSRALVSIVMRNEPGASPKNRERVWQAAKELDYRPNFAAQMLRRTRTKHLGVIYTMAHGLDADLVEALYPVAEEAGFSLALGAMTATRGWRRAAEELLEFRCEALIVIAPEDDPRGFAEVAHAAPLIAVGRRITGVDSVHIDDPATSRLAVDHLVRLGHQRIVHVGGGSQPGAAGRRKGYLDAMRAHGLEQFAHVVAGDYSEESGAQAGSRLLTEKIDFTAVAAANDRMAVGVINNLILEGLRVPDDVSIVGTDDSALARMSHRNLTSVSQRVPAFAKHVVELAVNRIDGSLEPSADVIVDPELVVRTSTAAPRVPARRVGPQPARPSQRTRMAPQEDTASIRQWAVSHGLEVSTRGRISAEVREAYKNRGASDGASEKAALPKIADPFKVSFD